MLTNKIVFYEAMRRVCPGFLRPLSVPAGISLGEDLRQRLQNLFALAVEIDYETVLTKELIDMIPFLAYGAVDIWRDIIDDVERYDFSRLGYDVIGRIFRG